MHYYFIGRIKSLTQDSNNKYKCGFNVETSIKIHDKLIGIAFDEGEVNFVKVPNELSISNQEVFSFFSLHSRDKFKIKIELKDDNTEQKNTEIDNGQKEQNKEKSKQKDLIVTEATLLNE